MKRLYVDINGGSVTDPQQLASNAALYTEIVTALTNNELPPQVGTLVSEGGRYTLLTNTALRYGDSTIHFIFYTGGSQSPLIVLTSDGNASMG